MTNKLDPISSAVVLWQTLQNGQLRDDIFEQVHNSLKGAMYRKLTAFSKMTGQQEDLLQEMAIVMLACMERFNPESGVKFSTYYLASIKLATNVFNRHQRIQIQMPQEALKKAGKSDTLPRLSSYDREHHVGYETLGPKWDLMYDKNWANDIENLEMKIDYLKITSKLRPLELDVLLRRMEGHLLKDIGKIYGFTQEYARQIFVDAMDVLQGRKRTSTHFRKRKPRLRPDRVGRHKKEKT